jgi:hypothetical protein
MLAELSQPKCCVAASTNIQCLEAAMSEPQFHHNHTFSTRVHASSHANSYLADPFPWIGTIKFILRPSVRGADESAFAVFNHASCSSIPHLEVRHAIPLCACDKLSMTPNLSTIP